MPDWLGWNSLTYHQQLYVVFLSGLVLGGWLVLVVETLFGGRGLPRRKAAAKARAQRGRGRGRGRRR